MWHLAYKPETIIGSGLQAEHHIESNSWGNELLEMNTAQLWASTINSLVKQVLPFLKHC